MVTRPLIMTLAIGTLLLGALAPTGSSLDQTPDGITALITFDGSPTDLVLVDDGEGNYAVSVSIFQNDGEGWEQISLRASLRVFEDGLFGASDRVSIPFTSSAAGQVSIAFPKDAVGAGTLDVFVTFSELGGSPVPTSHHHIAKNLAIQAGEFGLADSLDHHNTRVLGL